MGEELRDEIARMVQLFDPEFGTYKELANRILAIPRLREALKVSVEMDALDLPPLSNEQMRALLDKVTLGPPISTNTKGT